MPALRELMEFLCRQAEARGVSFGERCAREMEAEIRKRWPYERVYIPPADSRKDPERAAAIRAAAARLPTKVVTERFGVHRTTVYRLTRVSKK